LIELRPFPAVCRDPDDDKVVATAIQGNANYLLTADEDILASDVCQMLQQAGIRLTTIDEFIAQLDQQPD
jgi:predicted nucleic acid-binding protein